MIFTKVKRTRRDHESTRKEVLALGTAGRLDRTGELIGRIFKAIHRATSQGVRELKVAWDDDQLVLSGHCRTFYTKQIAQKAAMKLLGDTMLRNDIHVS